MALNSSGPISLGGSTAGQSVNLELGQVATATISFNDSAVRTLTGTTAGTALSLPGGFWSKSTSPYFFSFLDVGASSLQYPGAMVLDSSNNAYIWGSNGVLTSVSATGTANNGWTIKDATGYPIVSGQSFARDSSGNFYLCGVESVSGVGQCAVLFKLNSSGTILWQKRLTVAGASNGGGVALDGLGNIYWATSVIVGSVNSGIAFKLDASGNITWQRLFSHPSGAYFFYCFCDSSNNVFFAGQYAGGGLVWKYNSSGTAQWQYRLDYAPVGSGPNIIRGAVADSSGNVFVVSYDGDYYDSMIVAKVNGSTGATLWQRRVTVSGVNLGTQGYGRQPAVDAYGSVYIPFDDSSLSRHYIISLDSVGTLRWANKIAPATSASTFNSYPGAAAIDSNGYLRFALGFISGTSTGVTCVATQPVNGINTGTYTLAGVTFSYTPVTCTATTSTFSSGSASTTVSTPTYTLNTAALTSTAYTQTSSTQSIGISQTPTSFLTMFTNPSTRFWGQGVVGDSYSNIYVGSYYYPSTGGPLPNIFKFAQTGSFTSAITIPPPTATDFNAERLAYNYYANKVLVGSGQPSKGAFFKVDAGLLTLNSSYLQGASGSNHWGLVGGMSNGDTIYVENQQTTSLYYANIYRLDSTGAYVWRKKLSDPLYSIQAENIFIDSSDNIYVSGNVISTPVHNYGMLAKLDSSGNVLWNKRTNNSEGTGNDCFSVSVSGSNVFVNLFLGSYLSSGAAIAFAVFDTSGNFVASTGIANLPGGAAMCNITSDSTGLYVASGTGPGAILKLDNSLNLQWANSLTQTSGGSISTPTKNQTTGITKLANGNLAITSNTYSTPGTESLLVLCVPSDGSHTGGGTITLGSFTFTYDAWAAPAAVALTLSVTNGALTTTTTTDTLSSVSVPTNTAISGSATGPASV